MLAVENGLSWFSAARATGSWEQVHYSAWQQGMSSRASLWAKHNAEHRTSATPHCTNSRLLKLPSPLTFPSRSDAGTLPPLEFSVKGAQRSVDASNWHLPKSSPPLSGRALLQSPQAFEHTGEGGVGDLKHCDCFPTIALTPRINFIFVFRGYTSFLVPLALAGVI